MLTYAVSRYETGLSSPCAYRRAAVAFGMRFRQLDMNLLYALSILVEEGSVSRAASRLNVSQPTMSAILARLREYFSDALLVQQGRAMVPSPLALSLMPLLREVLANVNAMIDASHGFDPATSERCFCISTSDYFAATLVPRLIASVQAVAPRVTFVIGTSLNAFSQRAEHGEVDVVLIPANFQVLGQPATFLFQESYVVLGWRENPLIRRGMNQDEFYAADHLNVLPPLSSGAGHSISGAFLRSRGREYRMSVTASSFLHVPMLLAGSQRIAVLPRRLAEVFAEAHPVAFVDLPFAFDGFRAMVQHHASRSSDPGIGWLIKMIKQVAA